MECGDYSGTAKHFRPSCCATMFTFSDAHLYLQLHIYDPSWGLEACARPREVLVQIRSSSLHCMRHKRPTRVYDKMVFTRVDDVVRRSFPLRNITSHSPPRPRHRVIFQKSTSWSFPPRQQSQLRQFLVTMLLLSPSFSYI